MPQIKSTIDLLIKMLSYIPIYWDGKTCILEMRDSGNTQWRQMEWIGFYFQFLCEKYLSEVMQIPGPKYGRVEFDGFLEIPWDFKAHSINTASRGIIINDSDAISRGILEFGNVGLILAMGEAEYNDLDSSFQAWHTQIKGEISDYVKRRISRGGWSRKRKVSFSLKQLLFLQISDSTLVKTGTFQRGFRNSNDSPRRSKVLIHLSNMEDELVGRLSF
jgi:hypothetical protein